MGAGLEAPGGVVVVLLRHGRTAWNAEKRFLGRADVPLDDVGHGQVAKVAPGLVGRFDAVFSSPLQRALQTAAPVEPDPVVLDGLTELDLGELDGTIAMNAMNTHPEFLAKWGFDPTDVEAPGGGESMGAVQARALRALHAMAEAHPGGRVLGVTHQMVVAALSCHAVGEPLRRWRKYMIGNAEMSAFGVWPGRVELLAKGLTALA
ncbi:MAG: histidine phosphatase family protein [Alphaproteobacteria bacterium]|nr:histidine phosphatase family protein [Alphaproteobacteria bacterium]MCB9692490.1 histidine phosphatase family protein [Alphaproteobacteria bacterium]